MPITQVGSNCSCQQQFNGQQITASRGPDHYVVLPQYSSLPVQHCVSAFGLPFGMENLYSNVGHQMIPISVSINSGPNHLISSRVYNYSTPITVLLSGTCWSGNIPGYTYNTALVDNKTKAYDRAMRGVCFGNNTDWNIK